MPPKIFIYFCLLTHYRKFDRQILSLFKFFFQVFEILPKTEQPSNRLLYLMVVLNNTSTFFLYTFYIPISFNPPYDLLSKPFHFVTSTCTVDLLIPKCFAACLTVALFSIIYCAISSTLSSIYSFKKIPCNTCFYIVCRGFLVYSSLVFN